MVEKTDHPLADEAAARKRIAVLEDQFQSISDVLTLLTDALGGPDAHPPKAVLNKLMELQTVHVAVTKAHEAFHEKFSKSANDAGIDYDKVRDDIGRQLDRIRAALETKGISTRP